MAWPCDSKSYELVEKIGRGAFSCVWRAHYLGPSSSGGAGKAPSPVRVAIKVINLEDVQNSFEDILQEVQTMRLSDDVNILQFYCSFVQQDQLWLVTQLMDMGSCLRVMSVAKSAGFGEGMNEEWLAYIMREALQGLAYLHNNGQIHRDMKAGNILLDSQGGVRLADFGVSGWTFAGGQRQERLNTFVGTPCYMAPEVMEQAGGYDNRADIWSMGITALELAKGRAPYAHLSPMRVLIVTIEEDPPSLRSYANELQRSGAPFSSEFDDFYKKCLQKVPRARPAAEDLLKHKFLAGRSPEALINQLLSHIGIVGQAEHDQRVLDAGKLPGENVISIERVGDEAADSDASSSANSSGLHDGMGSLAFTSSGQIVTESSESLSDEIRAGAAPAGGGKSDYVPGTTWIFETDDEAGSSREYRTSSRSGSRRVQSIGSRQKHELRPSSTASSQGAKGPMSPSLDDLLTDFESEVSTLPSIPRDANNKPPHAPAFAPVPLPKAREPADTIEGFFDDFESVCDSEKP